MKETKQFITFLAAIAAQVVESSTDGDGLNFKDAPEFLDEFLKSPEALKGVSEIPGEIHNATSAERSALYAELSETIKGLTPDKLDGFVDAAAMIATGLDLAFKQYHTV